MVEANAHSDCKVDFLRGPSILQHLSFPLLLLFYWSPILPFVKSELANSPLANCALHDYNFCGSIEPIRSDGSLRNRRPEIHMESWLSLLRNLLFVFEHVGLQEQM